MSTIVDIAAGVMGVAGAAGVVRVTGVAGVTGVAMDSETASSMDAAPDPASVPHPAQSIHNAGKKAYLMGMCVRDSCSCNDRKKRGNKKARIQDAPGKDYGRVCLNR